MGFFNFFGDDEHRVFNYKPMYYDKEKEDRMRKFKRERGLREDERETRREDAFERWESDFLRREAEWKDRKYTIQKGVKARREATKQELKERKERQE